jgi:DNA-binding XRE family transcriptional regulator
VPENQRKLRKVVNAAQHVKEAESRLAAAREALYTNLREAQAAGITISAMARALGVSRQAIQKLIGRNPRG